MPTDESEDLLRRLAPQALGAVVRRYRDFDAAADPALRDRLLAGPGQRT